MAFSLPWGRAWLQENPVPSSGSENLCVCPPACPGHSLPVSSAGCEPPEPGSVCHRHSRTPCSVPRFCSRAEAGRAPCAPCLLQRLLAGAACPGLDGAGRKRGRGQLRLRGGGPDKNSRAIPLEPARDATPGCFLPVLPARPRRTHPCGLGLLLGSRAREQLFQRPWPSPAPAAWDSVASGRRALALGTGETAALPSCSVPTGCSEAQAPPALSPGS